jgi:hypothetical protein
VKTYSRGVSVFLECAIHSILERHHRGVTCADFPLTKSSRFYPVTEYASALPDLSPVMSRLKRADFRESTRAAP